MSDNKELNEEVTEVLKEEEVEINIEEEVKPIDTSKAIPLGDDPEKTENVTVKEPFKLNPEIKGMIGIFCVILVLGLIMAGSMGKFEQWFGIDIFAGVKVTNKILYVENGDTNKLQTYDITTGKTETIFEKKDFKDIAVSPTGKKLAYVAYDGDTPQIYISNPDGKREKVITKIEGSKSKPKFSPDGKYISYIANGRVFRADLNGSNSFSMLPTKQEQQAALNGRDGKLVMKDYVWSNTGQGMLGVVARSDEDERLVIMSDNNGDAHEVPFPDDMNCKFISLSAAPDAKAYTAVAKSHDIYIIFLIQEPEEHDHSAEAMTPQDMGVMPMPMGKDPISYAFLLPQGAGLMFTMKPGDKKMPEGIYALDFEKKSLQPAFPWYCDRFEFLYADKFLMYNNDGALNIIGKENAESGPETICEKVQSFAIAPPKEAK